MKDSAMVPLEAGLLDWPTAVIGFRQQWMSAEDVQAFAVNRILEELEPASEVVDLTSSQLGESDISEHLDVLAQASPQADERVLVRRWLFASLVVLDQSSADEDATMERLQEIYAEFGYPEELRYVSPYNFIAAGQDESLTVGDPISSPLECFRAALNQLRVELLGEVAERPVDRENGS